MLISTTAARAGTSGGWRQSGHSSRSSGAVEPPGRRAGCTRASGPVAVPVGAAAEARGGSHGGHPGPGKRSSGLVKATRAALQP